MSKRGSIEILIFSLVLIIALVGLYFIAFPSAGKAISTESYVSCEQDCYKSFTGDQLSSCLAGCLTLVGVPIGETYAEFPTGRVSYVPRRDSPLVYCQRTCAATHYDPYALRDCNDNCYRYSSVGNSYSGFSTGNFAMPVAKSYGGSIEAVSGSEPFSGRAYQISQSCFYCSCLEDGLTASSIDSAARACRDNCGGSIKSVSPGACR